MWKAAGEEGGHGERACLCAYVYACAHERPINWM
eukprot:SAG22_NODE_15743_length_342_cov_0.444444_1_plen_33_part_10